MSEDSFVTNYDRSYFHGNNLSDLYENCNKLQQEIVNLRRYNVELEGRLVEQTSLKSAMERKYQRALQDIEHYKIKPLIDKSINDSNEEPMELDYFNIYSMNEKNIKKNLVFEMKTAELERKVVEFEKRNFEIEEECESWKAKYECLQNAYEDLKSFVEEKKEELSSVNTLKLQINEMEKEMGSNDKIESNICSTFNKIDELQVKCFKLENENKKYRENHMNLLLLVEENNSLTKQVGFLEERLANLNQDHSFSHLNDSCSEINDDKWSSRKLRHLEKENEILKSQHVEIVEKNADLIGKINRMNDKINSLKDRNDILNDLFKQKQVQLELMENERIAYSKECNSYKNVLHHFSQQFSSNETCVLAEMIVNLNDLCTLLESHKALVIEQSAKFDQLTAKALYRLEQRDMDNNPQVNFTPNDVSADQKMIFELRQHVEQLSQQLEEQNKLINNFKKVESVSVDHHQESLNLQFHHYSEMGFSRNNEVSCGENEKNRRIFGKLTADLLEAIRKVFGYSLEIGPNGYLSVQSCLDDDPSHVLEFKITASETTLINNSYSMELQNQIDSNDCFPVLLSRLTLDHLVNRKEMLCCKI